MRLGGHGFAFTRTTLTGGRSGQAAPSSSSVRLDRVEQERVGIHRRHEIRGRENPASAVTPRAAWTPLLPVTGDVRIADPALVLERPHVESAGGRIFPDHLHPAVSLSLLGDRELAADERLVLRPLVRRADDAPVPLRLPGADEPFQGRGP